MSKYTSENQLNTMHANLSKYFETVLSLHNTCMTKLQDKLDSDEITIHEYILKVDQVSLPPALLTTIATFLKTNNIMVKTDLTAEKMEEFNDALDDVKKRISLADIDHKDIEATA